MTTIVEYSYQPFASRSLPSDLCIKMNAIFPARRWKRSNDVARFPKVWHKFRAEDKRGQVHEVQIQDMTPDQREEVWDIFKEHFYPDEELHRQINILDDHESMASERLVFDNIVDQNLTIVATLEGDSKSRRIVGCLLLIVISKQDSPLPDLPGEAAAKFDHLFHLLRDDINVFEKLNSNHLLKEFGLVVKREYRLMNIGTELFKTMERMGKIFHIPASVILLGSISSQTLSAKLGLVILKEEKLKDCKDEKGRVLFPDLDTAVIQYGYFKYF